MHGFSPDRVLKKLEWQNKSKICHIPKKDLVSEYIDKGIGFDKISWDILKEYGIADIKATKCLADYQLDILKTTYKEFI